MGLIVSEEGQAKHSEYKLALKCYLQRDDCDPEQSTQREVMYCDADHLTGNNWFLGLDAQYKRTKHEHNRQAQVSNGVLRLSWHFQLPEKTMDLLHFPMTYEYDLRV